MSCPKCNGPMQWRGSFARGKLACSGCDPDEDGLVWVPGKGSVSPTLARYYNEVTGFHREWCRGRKMAKATPGRRVDPQFCDCGFDQITPYSQKEIEQREIAEYGLAV